MHPMRMNGQEHGANRQKLVCAESSSTLPVHSHSGLWMQETTSSAYAFPSTAFSEKIPVVLHTGHGAVLLRSSLGFFVIHCMIQGSQNT